MIPTSLGETYGQTVIATIRGSDISGIDADAVITAVNSGGIWFDGTNNAIRRSGGQSFFDQLAKKELSDGKAVLARGPAFRHVIFVVDDLKAPLGEVVKKGLAAADAEGFEKVTLPDMRIVTRNIVGMTIEELREEIFKGAREYVQANANTHLRCIKLVFRD